MAPDTLSARFRARSAALALPFALSLTVIGGLTVPVPSTVVATGTITQDRSSTALGATRRRDARELSRVTAKLAADARPSVWIRGTGSLLRGREVRVASRHAGKKAGLREALADITTGSVSKPAVPRAPPVVTAPDTASISVTARIAPHQIARLRPGQSVRIAALSGRDADPVDGVVTQVGVVTHVGILSHDDLHPPGSRVEIRITPRGAGASEPAAIAAWPPGTRASILVRADARSLLARALLTWSPASIER